MSATTVETTPDAMSVPSDPSTVLAHFSSGEPMKIGMETYKQSYSLQSFDRMDEREIITYYEKFRMVKSGTITKAMTKGSIVVSEDITLDSIWAHARIGFQGNVESKGFGEITYSAIEYLFRWQSAVTQQGALVARTLPITKNALSQIWKVSLPHLTLDDYEIIGNDVWQFKSELLHIGADPVTGSALHEQSFIFANNAPVSGCNRLTRFYPIGALDIAVWNPLNCNTNTIDTVDWQLFVRYLEPRFSRPIFTNNTM